MLETVDRPRPRAPFLWGPVPPAPPGWSWPDLMGLALAEAEKGESAGEVPVGALVVAADGRLLASAHNAPVAQHDASAHAEILALRAAGEALGNYRLEGCVLVATLEPCLMCAGAAVHARVAGLVYGAGDTRAGAVMSCFNALDLPFHNHRVWHLGGVEADRCVRQLQNFFRAARVPASSV